MDIKIQKLIHSFVEEYRLPTTLEDTKIKNFLSHSKHFIKLDQYRRSHPENLDIILQGVAESLDRMDIYKGCCSAFFCGVMIGNTEPKEAAVWIARFFAKALCHACRVLDITNDEYPSDDQLDQLFFSDPDAVRAFRGMPPLMLAVMDTLAKSARGRNALRREEIYQELERLSPFFQNGSYILRIYPVCGPMEIVVLAPKSSKGMIVQIDNLGTNFHFMTLLERAFCLEGQAEAFGLSDDIHLPENQEIFQYSSGEQTASQNLSVTAHGVYTLYNGQLLFGEMAPDSIPALNGKPVVLIYPEIFVRTWDLYFAVPFHPYLHPHVEIIKILSPEETADWISRLPKPLEPGL